MRRWQAVLASGVLVAALAGCSGSDPSPAPATTSSGETGTASEQPSGTGACESGDATADDVEVTFGEISAASDEWAQDLGREWRHFIPVTVTNLTDTACIFSIDLDAAVEGQDTGEEELQVPLEPGQSFHGQAFALEEIVDFTADAEDATPVAEVTPAVYSLSKTPFLPGYYDLELTVDGVTGEGADALLTAQIAMTGLAQGMPERSSTVDQDDLYILGLDSAGDVITIAYDLIDPIPDGQTATVELAVGGGDSSGAYRNQMPVSAYDDVVSWEIVLEPRFTVDSEITF